MNELRLAIIFAFVVVFWACVFTIYLIVQGNWVAGVFGITALIPVSLMFWVKAR